MKGFSRKVTAGSRGIFVLMVLGVILFGIVGQLCLPGEGVREEGSCRTLSEGWVRVLPDGSNIPVQVPGRCAADPLESVSIEAMLPEDLGEDKWLCVRGSWQELELLVDQVVRRRYNAEESMPFGKNTPSAYVFLKLTHEDAGKVLRITSVSDSSYSGTLNTVYIGDRMGILTQLMKQHGGGLFLAMFLLVLSGISLLLSIVLRRFYHQEIVLEYLAWGTFLVSLWLVAGSHLRQFLFPNISVASGLSFLAAMLALFPLLIYMDSVQRQRYQKGYVFLELLVIAHFAVCTFLQITNQAEFMENAFSTCLLAAVAFLYIVWSLVRDLQKKKLGSYRLVAVGMVLLVVSAAVELAEECFGQWESGGDFLCVGLMCLLVLAIVENVRKLFYMEREKQRAILANESKGKFLANMSHEIRTPINTVIGMNEMILRENKDSAIREYAANIESASKTLMSLVNDVLDFSKMESGSLDIDNNSYYLSSLLNDTIHVLQARAEKKHLQVRLNVDEALPSILEGDEVRIRKVLNQLFSNSIKFTQDGSITFSTQGEWNGDGTFCLVFSVADTGIGIREEELAKLYHSFVKLEEDGYRTVQGTGLGLNLAKRFVEQMHGDIRVQSVYGAGTIFTVRIPQEIKDAQPIGDLQQAYEREQQELAKPREFLKAPDAHVLSVDDNEMNLAVVRGLLKRTDIQLDTVLDGRECMDCTRKIKYDLIFMDHMMPEPDGISTLHRLRAEEGNPNRNTPVVVLTANAVAGSREEYLQAGFDEYLSKPIVVEKLEQMLQKYLPKEKVFFEKEQIPEISEETGWEEIFKDMPGPGQAVADMEEETERATEDSSAARAEERKENSSAEELPGKTDNLAAGKKLIDKSVGLPYCGNDEEMYQEILQAYYEQGQEYHKKLPKLYEEKDWSNYGIIVHAIKSTSLTIGAAGLSEQAKQQEFAAKDNNIEELRAHWEKFYHDYTNVLGEAVQLLGVKEQESSREEAASGKELPPLEYLEGCHFLLELVQGYEMGEALEQIDRLWSMREERMLEEVRQFVHDFEYDRAESRLEEWLAKWEVGKE